MECIPVKGKAFEVHYGYDDGNGKNPSLTYCKEGGNFVDIEEIFGVYLCSCAKEAVNLIELADIFNKYKKEPEGSTPFSLEDGFQGEAVELITRYSSHILHSII